MLGALGNRSCSGMSLDALVSGADTCGAHHALCVSRNGYRAVSGGQARAVGAATRRPRAPCGADPARDPMPASHSRNPQVADLGVWDGAGDENRTRALSLGSSCSTIKLRPPGAGASLAHLWSGWGPVSVASLSVAALSASLEGCFAGHRCPLCRGACVRRPPFPAAAAAAGPDRARAVVEVSAVCAAAQCRARLRPGCGGSSGMTGTGSARAGSGSESRPRSIRRGARPARSGGTCTAGRSSSPATA